MLNRLPFYETLRQRAEKLGPGTRGFLKSLSVVSLCFAVSKFFASIAIVIMARYLGKQVFGQGSVILLVAQVIFPLMLFGLHTSVMKFGAGKKEPGPYIATTFYISLVTSVVVAAVVWTMRSPLGHWLAITDLQVGWSIGLATVMSAYMLFTHYYQALNLFKQRGLIEIALGVALLPGLAVGHFLTGVSFKTMLITYAVAYSLCLPTMVWRFRKMLSPRNLWAPDSWDMVKYGSFACFSGVGFLLTFVVQPLQLNWYTDESQVGIYRLYCASSVSLATFATTIFYTVFFPKVAASQNKREIWRLMTRAWVKAFLPLLAMYAVVFSVSVWVSGKDYPLTPLYIFLFSGAATLITIQTTYGQMMAAQGIAGMRWVLVIGISSGIVNVLLSRWLIPLWGVEGAVLTLILNFSLSLLAMLSLKNKLFVKPQASQ